MTKPFKRKSFALSLGLIALLLVFLLNLRTNLYLTSLIRGIIAFIVFYLLGSLLYIVNYANTPKRKYSIHQVNLESETNLDMDEVYQTIKTDGKLSQNKNNAVEFQPLELKKIKLSE